MKTKKEFLVVTADNRYRVIVVESGIVQFYKAFLDQESDIKGNLGPDTDYMYDKNRHAEGRPFRLIREKDVEIADPGPPRKTFVSRSEPEHSPMLNSDDKDKTKEFTFDDPGIPIPGDKEKIKSKPADFTSIQTALTPAQKKAYTKLLANNLSTYSGNTFHEVLYVTNQMVGYIVSEMSAHRYLKKFGYNTDGKKISEQKKTTKIGRSASEVENMVLDFVAYWETRDRNGMSCMKAIKHFLKEYNLNVPITTFYGYLKNYNVDLKTIKFK